MSVMERVKKFSLLCVFGLVSLTGGQAIAEPALQLYIEGSTYDHASETWIIDTNASSFRLWAIGNVGQFGTIYDVKIAAVYDSPDNHNLKLKLEESTTGDHLGFTDDSIATSAIYHKTVTDGSTPLLGDGSPLPNHGEYGTGRTWQEFHIGDFNLIDSKIGNFDPIGGDPEPSTKMGQINVYEVTISNAAEGTVVHFDLYNHVMGKTKAKYVFAPFSHDAGGSHAPPPDPGGENPPIPTPMAAGMGIISFALLGLRRTRRTRA